MINLLLELAIAFVMTYLVILPLRKVAIRFGFVDKPTPRKRQREPLPMLGGFGMALVFIVLVAILFHGSAPQIVEGLVFGTIILLAVGFIDDYAKTRGKDFPALPKLIGQILAAVILVQTGTSIHGLNLPFGHAFIILNPLVGQLLTILWIVGLINAFNFIDGVDGLAGGVAAISGATLMLIAILKGQTVAAQLAALFVGAALGYLRHNFFPAKIIMGDAGSMFLGFTLGAISILGALKSVTVVSVLVPIIALGLPIFDAAYVVVRRIRARKPIYSADRTHAHYRLIDGGLHPKQAVLFLYLICACLGLGSMVITLL